MIFRITVIICILWAYIETFYLINFAYKFAFIELLLLFFIDFFIQFCIYLPYNLILIPFYKNVKTLFIYTANIFLAPVLYFFFLWNCEIDIGPSYLRLKSILIDIGIIMSWLLVSFLLSIVLTRIMTNNKRKKILIIFSILFFIIPLFNIHYYHAGLLPQKKGEYPNILFITIDTLRADSLGCYHNKIIKTPNIDYLAKNGIKYNNVITVSPVTLPAHTTLFTGLTPMQSKVMYNGYIVSKKLNTVSELLLNKGYYTAGFTSGFVLDGKFGLNQGFLHYDDYYIKPKGIDKFVILQLLSKFKLIDFNMVERNAGTVTKRVINWLQNYKSKHSFFIWLHYFDAHAPYRPPQKFNIYDADYLQNIEKINEKVKEAKARYYGEISYVDSQIGYLLSKLKEFKLRKNTVVIITADHGESFEHNYYYQHAERLYNSIIKIPLIIYFPGNDKKLENNRIVSSNKIWSIIFKKINERYLKNKSDYLTGKNFVFSKDDYDTAFSMCIDDEMPSSIGDMFSIQNKKYKLIEILRDSEINYEFYNLHKDFKELTDLMKNASESISIKNILLKELDKYRDKQNLKKIQLSKQNKLKKLNKKTKNKLKALGYFN